MATRAIKLLEAQGIPFEIVKYEHVEKGALFAARAVGFPLERTIKTLVVDLGRRRYVFALMPGDKQISFKQLAKLCAVKRVAMVDAAMAQRLTGYQVGGISPFGSKQALPVIMEKSLIGYDKVLINAGQRGVMLMMAPEDILETLGCRVAYLAASEI